MTRTLAKSLSNAFVFLEAVGLAASVAFGARDVAFYVGGLAIATLTRVAVSLFFPLTDYDRRHIHADRVRRQEARYARAHRTTPPRFDGGAR